MKNNLEEIFLQLKTQLNIETIKTKMLIQVTIHIYFLIFALILLKNNKMEKQKYILLKF